MQRATNSQKLLLKMGVVGFEPVMQEVGDNSKPKRGPTKALQQNASKPTGSWKRRKDELERLRAESKTLEMHLAFLELQKTLNTSAKLSQAQMKWKNAAETEKHLCHIVKEENYRLKSKVQSYSQTCKSLQATLSVKQSEFTMIHAHTANVLYTEMRTNFHLQSHSSFIFDMLETQLDARRNKIEDIVREGCVHVPEVDVNEIQVHRQHETDTTAALELKQRRLMPFDAEQTSDTVWNVVKLGFSPDDQYTRARPTRELQKAVSHRRSNVEEAWRSAPTVS